MKRTTGRKRRTVTSASYSRLIITQPSHRATGGFDAAKQHLEAAWKTDLEPIAFKQVDSMGAGWHLEILRGEHDDQGRPFILVWIPGDATTLGAINNEDANGIVYTIHNVWWALRQHARVPVYVLADRFDDRLIARFDLLNGLIPEIAFVPTRNLIHASKPQVPRSGSAEADFAQSVADHITGGRAFAGHRLQLLGREVPGGWAASRVERIDLLAVDDSGRLVIMELKALPKTGASRLRGAVFQGLRYTRWAEHFGRALQIAYGGERVTTAKAKPSLYLVNAGAEFPEEVLRFGRLGGNEGIENLVKFFHCPDVHSVAEIREVSQAGA